MNLATQRLQRAHRAVVSLQRRCADCTVQAASTLSEEDERQDPRAGVHHGLQARARFQVGASGDAHEREAERAAQRVMTGGIAQVAPGSADGAGTMQRVAGTPTGDAIDAAVSGVLETPGHALDAATRSRFEPRFGHDFSRVRIHHDARAAASADTVDAHAYTVGNHLVFGAGQYAPDGAAGQHLLAHELAHVIQQDGNLSRVQRDGKEKDKPGNAPKEAPAAPAGPKRDVSIVLSDNARDHAEGAAHASTVLRVISIDDARDKLMALNAPIGSLFVISHSTATGQLQFVGGNGGISWKPAEELAAELKGKVTIDDVDFRGCKIGDAPGTLETVRERVGAQSAKGSNCWTFIRHVTPLTVGGVELTRQDQVKPGMQADLDSALFAQLSGMKTEDGRSVQRCILGLPKGKPAELKDFWTLYWERKGHLVAEWASPDYDETWQRNASICTQDMTAATKPCALVEARKAPTP